jgi:putative effector of murein hydrolase
MGGEPSLTASIVVATGILGAVLGPVLLHAFGIVNGTPFGLAIGASSHGIGTARAVKTGSL